MNKDRLRETVAPILHPFGPETIGAVVDVLFPLIEEELATHNQLQGMMDEAFHTSAAHGFWEDEPMLDSQRRVHYALMKIGLMHAELSETFEEIRVKGINGLTFIRHDDGKPEGVPIELADTCIRIFDFCARYGIDLPRAIGQKMDYNRERPFKHGGKLV